MRLILNLEELKAKSFKIIRKRFNKNLKRAYGRSISHNILDKFNYELSANYGKYVKEPFEGPYNSIWYDDVFKECDSDEATSIRIYITFEDIRGFMEFKKSELFNIDKIAEKIAIYSMNALINEME